MKTPSATALATTTEELCYCNLNASQSLKNQDLGTIFQAILACFVNPFAMFPRPLASFRIENASSSATPDIFHDRVRSQLERKK